MKVELYRTILCPRCLHASHALRGVAASLPGVEIETIEVITNPGRAREAAIRTVPAIRAGGVTLTGLILTPARIRAFLEEQLRRQNQAGENAPS
ncbi:MAG: glutaredoxin family protein [Thermodesulfobacteriota bacterium]